MYKSMIKHKIFFYFARNILVLSTKIGNGKTGSGPHVLITSKHTAVSWTEGLLHAISEEVPDSIGARRWLAPDDKYN